MSQSKSARHLSLFWPIGHGKFLTLEKNFSHQRGSLRSGLSLIRCLRIFARDAVIFSAW
jgi:hypothetical protein